MTKISAGLLMCRVFDGELQYFLVHPGGPYFRKKEEGFWTIPKGLPDGDEELIETAKREFFEETGIAPTPPFYELGNIRQKGGKIVHAWAFRGSWEPGEGIQCNRFSIEWPPGSGKRMEFPEVDRAGWFLYRDAVTMIKAEQIPFLNKGKELFMGEGSS